ncbi:MAG: trk system potassium uptake protein TrkH [Rhodobacteraceae bacterium HLUCCA12]|nr:MAG: trk system potassium uptake protein TrkH [Rhodobacteraceae bacterium HLUCCA12]
MLARLAQVPVLVLMIGATGLAMLVPSGHAFAFSESPVGRAFLYSALVCLLLSALLAIATSRPSRRSSGRGLFPLLAAIYLVLPALMALPMTEVLNLRFFDAWFEMISSFTTTGASLIDAPRQVPDAVHLWRAMAGWFGGLFVLVAATALLAPLGLGGVELIRLRTAPSGVSRPDATQGHGQRLKVHGAVILPWYAGLTAALWFLLVLAGVPGLSALVQAMSTLSTSGIVLRQTLGGIGFWAEAAIFVFLILALSRGFLPSPGGRARRAVDPGPELPLAAVIVGLVTLVVAARHWLGAFEVAEGENLPALGRAIWGTLFTSLSFLTTTGFVSHDWAAMRLWSGLTPPGLVLMGLAIIGGGVATTAGGVKLLRVYALARMGGLELQRMIYPSMVMGGGARQRFLMTHGAHAAWLFAMVFALTAAVLLALLMLFGMSFETGLIFTFAALTTTGQLVQVAGDLPLHWWLLSDPAKAALALGMILGRLEILALLALLMTRFARD